MAREASQGKRREPPGVATGAILGVTFGFLAFVALSLWLLNIYYRSIIHGAVIAPPQPFPAPRVQADQAAELAELLIAQKHRLTTYGWVDRDQGLVRVPIERAMAMIAARGNAAYAPLEAPPPEPTRVTAPTPPPAPIPSSGGSDRP